jgi:hypothetical protein
VVSLTLRKGHCFITSFDDSDSPIFVKTIAFVSSDGNTWFIVVEMLITCGFHSHFHAYSVKRAAACQYSRLSFDELVDHNPLFPCTTLPDVN